MQTQAQIHPASETIYHCPDCTWTGRLDDLASIKDACERVSEGELMAAGECPDCGALISIQDQDVPDYTLDAVAQIMIQRGWSVAAPSADNSPISTLKARIEADLATLRALADEPVAIRYGEQISIEIRPKADDDRVSVLHSRLGFVATNYDVDALAVDVGDNGGNILQSVVVAADDLDCLRESF